MSRFFGILILIVVISVAVYLALMEENKSEYSFPILKGRDALVSTFQRVKNDNLESNISEGIDSLVEKLFNKVESTIDSVVDSVKSGTFRKVKNAVNERMDSLGESAGIDIQGISSSPSSGLSKSVVYTVELGTPAYFTVINRENRSLDYEVDWKDGNKDTGFLKKGERKVLSHEWDNEGEYFIKFKIVTIGEEEEYQFLINIF